MRNSSCLMGVKLGNISCNLSRFRWSHDVKGTFLLGGAANHCDASYMLPKVELISISCNGSGNKNVAW